MNKCLNAAPVKTLTGVIGCFSSSTGPIPHFTKFTTCWLFLMLTFTVAYKCIYNPGIHSFTLEPQIVLLGFYVTGQNRVADI